MTGKMLAKSLTAVVLSLTLVFTIPLAKAPASASSLSDMQQKQSSLKQQQKEIDSELDKLKNDKADKEKYKDELDAQITNIEQQIDNLNSQISDLDKDILTKQTQIAGKQKEIDADFQKLKQRVYALYLTGEASNLEIVLNAKNIMDLADKTELLQVISEHDTSLINNLKDDLNSVKVQKQQIEANRSAVSEKKTEMDQNQQSLKTLEAQTQQVIAQLGQTEQQKKAESDKNAAEQSQMEQAIDNWVANYYASQKSQSQSQNSGSGSGNSNGGGSSNGGGTSNGGSVSAGSGGYESTGNFTWPVPSCTIVTRPFGDTSVGGSPHKGIDIGASYGSTIVAADSGRVVLSAFGTNANEHNGYGNVVVIDHGNGYMSLYAHMSSRAVSAGETVTKGQTIGYVGATGEAFGAHLHFEIRQNGCPVNPMGYFG